MIAELFFSREPAFEEAGFIGRKELLAWIEARLSSMTPQNISLVGEPRIGKTSVLYQAFKKHLGLHTSDRGLYVWMPLTALPAPDSLTFWSQILSKLEAAYHEDGAESKDWTELDEDEVFDVFSQRLQQLVEEEGYRRIVFFLDDFDVLFPNGLKARDLDWLRSVVTNLRTNVAFVVTSTVPLQTLTATLQTRSISPFYNVFNSRWVPLLSRQEAEELILAASDSAGYPAPESLHLDWLIQEAGRHPDLLRIISEYYIAARAETEGDGDATNLLDAVQADFRYDSHVDWLYGQLFSRRTRHEQQTLVALAAGPSNVDTVLLHHLASHLGVVARKEGRYAPFSASFRAWLTARAASVEPGDAEIAATELPSPGNGAAPQTLYFDPLRRQVRIGNEAPKHLTKLEYRIMDYMSARVGEVCTHEELLLNIWGGESNRAVVEKAMNRLRSKLEPDASVPQYVVSVRGQGYKLQNSELVGGRREV